MARKKHTKKKKVAKKPKKPATLKKIAVSTWANLILDEIQKEESVNSLEYGPGGRTKAVLLDEILDTFFLSDFLFRHVNFRQVEQAKTYAARCLLTIFYLRARRCVPGYTAKETSAVFVSQEEQEKFFPIFAESEKGRVK